MHVLSEEDGAGRDVVLRFVSGEKKKKPGPFKQNGTERLRGRLTGPRAEHLPGCQEFGFALGGTSRTPSPPIPFPVCGEGQTVFKIQQMGSGRALKTVSLRYDVCVAKVAAHSSSLSPFPV